MRDREAHNAGSHHGAPPRRIGQCLYVPYHREQLQLIVSTTNQRALKMRLRAGLTGCVGKVKQDTYLHKAEYYCSLKCSVSELQTGLQLC